MVGGQLGQGIRQDDTQFAPLGRLAGRMPVGSDQVEHGTRRCAEEVVQRLLAPDRARAGRLEPADQVGQVPRQDPAQPGDQLRLSLALKLLEVLVGLQERFLDQVGGVRLAP